MKATMILGGSGANHPGGTASVLCAGLHRAWVSTKTWRGSMLVHVEFEAGDRKEAHLSLDLVNDDGRRESGGPYPVTVRTDKVPGFKTFVIGVYVNLLEPVTILMVLRTETMELAQWTLRVEKLPPGSRPAGPDVDVDFGS